MQTSQILHRLKAGTQAVIVEYEPIEELSVLEKLYREVAMPTESQMLAFTTTSMLQEIEYSEKEGIKQIPVTDFEPPSIDESIVYLANYIEQYSNERLIFILIDIQPYLGASQQHEDLYLIRKTKDLINELRPTLKRLIFLGRTTKLSPELKDIIPTIPIDSKTQALETERAIEIQLKQLKPVFKTKTKTATEDIQKLALAAKGLSSELATRAMRLSAIESIEAAKKNSQVPKLDTEAMAVSLTETKKTKLREMGLTISDPPTVKLGGLQPLKDWLTPRHKLFTEDREKVPSSLPLPKGMLIVGIPGTGKSLAAKTIGQQWAVPTINLNMASVFGSLVGESEDKITKILSLLEAAAPCILWIDELEKALAGSGSSFDGDSGTSKRVFGILLSWMQEHTEPVFVVATANNIAALPPELSRKGRFDEIFFVGLPSETERLEILQYHITKHDSELASNSTVLQQLAKETKDFTGAEIEACVNEAAIESYAQDTYPTLNPTDIQNAIATCSPIATREPEKIAALLQWAKSTNARSANSTAKSVAGTATKVKSSKGSRKIAMLES